MILLLAILCALPVEFLPAPLEGSEICSAEKPWSLPKKPPHRELSVWEI